MTLAEMRDLPYEPTDASVGLLASDYRALDQEHGEPFLYWDAVTTKTGVIYHYVETSGQKGRFYQSKTTVQDATFGLIQKGTSMFSALPDAVEVMRGGFVLRVAQSWRHAAQTKANGGAFDELPQRFVASIESVTAGGVLVPATHYEATPANGVGEGERGGLTWLSNAPATGTLLTVKYRYHPLFKCLGETISGSPIGADGLRLPVNYVLELNKS